MGQNIFLCVHLCFCQDNYFVFFFKAQFKLKIIISRLKRKHAVWKSRNHTGSQLRNPWNYSSITTLWYRGISGKPSIREPFCLGAQVFWTAHVNFSSVRVFFLFPFVILATLDTETFYSDTVDFWTFGTISLRCNYEWAKFLSLNQQSY